MGIDIQTPWGAVINKVGDLLSKVLPDKAAAAAAVAQLQMLQAQGALTQELTELAAITSAQTDVNKVEAASASIFIAGWRPFVGWVCGVALGVSSIVAPLFTWLATLAGHPVAFPVLTDPLLQATLAGMLGLGHVSRTIEKIQGVAAQH